MKVESKDERTLNLSSGNFSNRMALKSVKFYPSGCHLSQFMAILMNRDKYLLKTGM
jgi:hypothetical protein